MRQGLYGFFLWLCVAFTITACVPTRPVVKIGLIAPFEGVYRRTGYEALAAMRLAIAEMPTAQIDIVPLALDDANSPVRAYRTAQKIALSQSVQAIIGPFSPATALGVADALSVSEPPSVDGNGSELQWIVPFSVDQEEGFIDPDSATRWADPLIVAIANTAHEQQGQRLLLAGWSAGWPASWLDYGEQEWARLFDLPIAWADSSGEQEPVPIQPTDAILWLGQPHEAAAYLNQIRQSHPTVPFWMGPQGGDPVFIDHLLPGIKAVDGPIYWATWSDPAYGEWAESHSPATPNGYLVYQATRRAIHRATRATTTSLPEAGSWYVQIFKLGADGIHSAIE